VKRLNWATEEQDMLTTITDQAIRELDHRVSDGIDVWLLWNSRTNQVSVMVVDGRTGEQFELPVAPADALDAFHHPYAYAEFTTDVALAA
jgi:hypothetical protein